MKNKDVIPQSPKINNTGLKKQPKKQKNKMLISLQIIRYNNISFANKS